MSVKLTVLVSDLDLANLQLVRDFVMGAATDALAEGRTRDLSIIAQELGYLKALGEAERVDPLPVGKRAGEGARDCGGIHKHVYGAEGTCVFDVGGGNVCGVSRVRAPRAPKVPPAGGDDASGNG